MLYILVVTLFESSVGSQSFELGLSSMGELFYMDLP